MNVKNCRKCGRIFNYIAGPCVCPSCREALEADFQRVKEYIRAHAGATITEVAEECDVEPAQIHQWLREERLEIAEGSAIVLRCESCGAPIKSGKYCEKCKRELAHGLSSAIKTTPAPTSERNSPLDSRESGRMRYLNK